MAVGKSNSPLFYFSVELLLHMAMQLHLCPQKFLARPFRPRPQKKVRSTPYNLNAGRNGCAAGLGWKRLHVRALVVRLDLRGFYV